MTNPTTPTPSAQDLDEKYTKKLLKALNDFVLTYGCLSDLWISSKTTEILLSLQSRLKQAEAENKKLREEHGRMKEAIKSSITGLKHGVNAVRENIEIYEGAEKIPLDLYARKSAIHKSLENAEEILSSLSNQYPSSNA